MTDKRTQELHRVCLEWAEANRAAGVPVAIGQPYYLVNAITATLNKIESSGTPPFGHVHRATHEQLKETAKRLQDERDAAYMRMAELEAELVFHQAHVGELVAQLVEARKDAERIDFLERHKLGPVVPLVPWMKPVYEYPSIRSAIDAALTKETKP